MRGKPRCEIRRTIQRRITPAHAGKTKKKDIPFLHVADHPRACGENQFFISLTGFKCGSPPRMRGKLTVHFLLTIRRRITPAHAGKTLYQRYSAKNQPDHPRACGENDEQTERAHDACGSPPRMRGKPLFGVISSKNERITPAHAGKTFCTCGNRNASSDHPRACGENEGHSFRHAAHSGSPPRMRGKPVLNGCKVRHTRITPAHAGKTSKLYHFFEMITDHPRACGENMSM